MRTPSKAGLFLIELIIIIAFFALASATCMRLFVHSHTVSEKSHNLNMAVNAAQSAAECFRAAEGDPARMLLLLSHAEAVERGFVVYYDKNWQPDGAGKFQMSVRLSGEGGIAVAAIEVRAIESADLIYSLSVKYYTGLEGAA